MKNKYEKPMICIESFEINQHIAGSCNITEGANHYKHSCSIGTMIENEFGENQEVNLFSSPQACDTTPACLDTFADNAGYFFS